MSSGATLSTPAFSTPVFYAPPSRPDIGTTWAGKTYQLFSESSMSVDYKASRMKVVVNYGHHQDKDFEGLFMENDLLDY